MKTKLKLIHQGKTYEYSEDKIFIIGDVHGCYNTLEKLLKKLPKKSLKIFVGDLNDKGKFTEAVIEHIINNEDCISIKGNHEKLMELLLKEGISGNINNNYWIKDLGWGGIRTVKQYKNNPQFVDKHLEFIKNLPLYIEFDKYFITHGFGLPYWERRYEEKSERALLSNRIDRKEHIKEWENDYEEYPIINIFGHCSFKEVKKGKNFYGIDTGCVYGNKLTAIQLKTMKLFSVKTCRKDID